MTLKGDAKFKGNLTRGLKNNTRNLVNFHARSRQSENLHFDGLLLSKTYKVRWKSARELCLMTLKNDAKFEEKLTFVPKMTWGIWWILMRVVESLEICTLMCSFCRKYIMFEPKKYREVVCNNTEEWCKIWGRTDLCFVKWHEEFGEFWLNAQNSQNLHYNGLLLSKVYNVWAKKV